MFTLCPFDFNPSYMALAIATERCLPPVQPIEIINCLLPSLK